MRELREQNWKSYQRLLKRNARKEIVGCIIMVVCTLLVVFLCRPWSWAAFGRLFFSGSGGIPRW